MNPVIPPHLLRHPSVNLVLDLPFVYLAEVLKRVGDLCGYDLDLKPDTTRLDLLMDISHFSHQIGVEEFVDILQEVNKLHPIGLPKPVFH